MKDDNGDRINFSIEKFTYDPNFDMDKIQLIEGEIHVLSVMGFNKFELDDRVFPLSPKEYKYFEDKGYEVTYPNLVNKGYITWG